MARRADHTRPELLQLATEAGWNIVRTQGVAEFSARKVAAAIGYTIGTIYNVFGTHENLLLHINGKTLDHWFAAMEHEMQNVKSAKAIHTLAAFYIDYSHANRAIWQILFETSVNNDPLPDWYRQKLRRFFAFLEQAIVATTKTTAAKARRDAQLLWAGIHGICVLSLSGKLELVGTETPHVLAKSLIDTYLRGRA